MTPTSTPRPQISQSEAKTLRTHARTIVEGEGAEEFSPELIEAVARAIYAAQGGSGPDDFVLIGDPGVEPRVGKAWEWALPEAHAALSTIRKHQAGE